MYKQYYEHLHEYITNILTGIFNQSPLKFLSAKPVANLQTKIS